MKFFPHFCILSHSSLSPLLVLASNFQNNASSDNSGSFYLQTLKNASGVHRKR